MRIHCDQCGSPIAAEDVNLALALARCTSCDSVFSFADQVGVDEGALPGSQPDALQPVPIPTPAGFEVGRAGEALEIHHRWFAAKYLFMAVFTVFWCGFLVFWYAMAASAGSVVAMLFPLIHVAAGVFLAYLTVAGFVNTTTVRVSAGRLTVEHGPLPWPGQRDLSTDDIEQLYCQEKTVRTKNGTRTTYQLAAATRHGRDVKLVSGLAELSPARFLEYELEAHLGIADRPVVGEVPKRVG